MKLIRPKYFFLSALLLTNSIWANSNSLLNQAGSEIDLNSQIQTQKSLNLDNPFVIQLFSAWKAAGLLDMSINQWVELVLNKDYEQALSLILAIREPKMTKIVEATELYLLYKTKKYQTLVNKWIDLSSQSPFLQTELGLSLDQVIGDKSTELLLEQGIFLTDTQMKNLSGLENYPTKFNHSLQAFKALRSGENATRWIGKLEENDPLRMPLAKTALLFYAKDGKLGASGKIIKTVVEPILNKSDDEEEISLYFLSLARLLYQAGALQESRKYYDLIPASSRHYLKARSESLWAHLIERDYSRTKGELASLEMNIFNKEFYPEAYLVSAMANVMLCQFNESRDAINRFVEVNKIWAKEIASNIGNPHAKPIELNYFLMNLNKAEVSLNLEIRSFEEKDPNSVYLSILKEKLSLLEKARASEIQTQWKNRNTLLETALYKIKFVRIELLSRMRQFELNRPIANRDDVKTQLAAGVKRNQLKFKNDGVLFGDELFHMSASITNKCHSATKSAEGQRVNGSVVK